MRLCVDRPGGSKTLYVGLTDGDCREVAMNSYVLTVVGRNGAEAALAFRVLPKHSERQVGANFIPVLFDAFHVYYRP